MCHSADLGHRYKLRYRGTKGGRRGRTEHGIRALCQWSHQQGKQKSRWRKRWGTMRKKWARKGQGVPCKDTHKVLPEDTHRVLPLRTLWSPPSGHSRSLPSGVAVRGHRGFKDPLPGKTPSLEGPPPWKDPVCSPPQGLLSVLS